MFSCGSLKDENSSPVVGSWVASEISFDHANNGGDYLVEIRSDHSLVLSKPGSDVTEIKQWQYKKDIITIESKNDPIIKAAVFWQNNNMKWDKNGKILFLVPQKK